MKRLPYILALIVVIFVGMYISASWYFSSQVLVFSAVPLDESVAAAPNESNNPNYRNQDRWRPPFEYPKERLTFEVNDLTLVGNFYNNPADGNCAVIYVHGFNSDKDTVGLYGHIFYDLGCHILAYDSRAHGESEQALLSWGYHERDEVAAAVDWLSQRTTLPVNQIGVIGVSYGASSSLQMLFVRDDIAFIVADSPYQDMQTVVSEQAISIFGDVIRIIFPGTFTISELRAGLEVDDTSAMKAVQDATTPVLLFHSQSDTFVPPSNSENIYANANPDTTRFILQPYDSLHAEAVLTYEAEMRQQIYDFLDEFAPNFGNTEMIVRRAS